MKLRAGSLLLALLWTRGALAERVVPLATLEAQAVERRALLDVERARVEATRSGVDVAASSRRPRVGLSLFVGGGSGSELIRVNDVNGDEYLTQGSAPLSDARALTPRLGYGAGLLAEQTLYDFGRTRAAVDAAAAAHDGARENLQAARQRVVREVRLAYLAWLGAAMRLRAAEDGAGRARLLRERIEARVLEGLRPPADTTAATRQELVAELEVEKMRGALAAARLALERAVGAALPTDAVPDQGLLQRKPREQAAPSAELSALRKEAQAALAGARAHDQRSLPQLTAQANAGVRGQDELLAPYYDVRLTLAVPLWDGGSGGGQARAERARADVALAQSRELGAALASERALALSDFQTAVRRVALGQKLLELAASRLRDAEHAYDAGTAPLEAVFDAEGDLARAQQELAASELARAEAAIRLER